MSEQWGYGNGYKNLDGNLSKPFAKTFVGKTPVELLTGEFPHSRSDSSHYARFPSGKIEAFDGHYTLVSVEYKAENYLKQSGLSGNEIRKGGICRISFNEECVYEFFSRDPVRALNKAALMIAELLEHSSDIRKGLQSLVGRKVYYQNTAAIICAAYSTGVILESEDKLNFPPPAYALEVNDDFGYEATNSIKVDVLSPHIWWFRK